MTCRAPYLCARKYQKEADLLHVISTALSRLRIWHIYYVTIYSIQFIATFLFLFFWYRWQPPLLDFTYFKVRNYCINVSEMGSAAFIPEFRSRLTPDCSHISLKIRHSRKLHKLSKLEVAFSFPNFYDRLHSVHRSCWYTLLCKSFIEVLSIGRKKNASTTTEIRRLIKWSSQWWELICSQ